MNAVRIHETGSSSVLNYESVADAEIRPNQVCIKVTAAAVNYIDALIRSGDMPPGMMPELPFIPGVECIGIVESTGTQVKGFTAGDKVAYFGEIGASTYADYVQASADSLVRIPSSVNDAEAAVIPVNYSTAYHMLHNLAGISSESVILVHAAAGGVGTAIVQLARLVGAKIIGSVGSDEKRQSILQEGADFAINYKTQDLKEAIADITKGRGVDYSFNPIAGASMISDLENLAPFGQLIIFGFIAGMPEEKLQASMLNHFGKSLTVRYSDIYTLYKQDFARLRSMLITLFELLAEQKISPRVYQEVKLSNAPEAHDLLESGKVVGKVVLVP